MQGRYVKIKFGSDLWVSVWVWCNEHMAVEDAVHTAMCKLRRAIDGEEDFDWEMGSIIDRKDD